MDKRKVIIAGAAGRDFHNFNLLYRDNEDYEVVAFTATQIPDIDDRKYPSELAGKLYPNGIPIVSETELPNLVERERNSGNKVDVVFSYSDVPHEHVMRVASVALAKGANFLLPSPEETMIESSVPVVSICAVRTGCGKSQTTRAVSDCLTNMGKMAVAIRHPMPYGNLVAQRLQRFAQKEDLEKHDCTIEEMEEYEPHIDRGRIIYAGVDYEDITREAEKDADVIIWDGGNNDTPFLKSDLEIVVADPHRTGHELGYHPGNTNFLRADLFVINKVDSAEPAEVERLVEHCRTYNPQAKIIKAESTITVEDPSVIQGKRVLVVEDGPTLTHGEMKYGAGTVAARRNGAEELVDPRSVAVGTIKDTFEKYPDIGVLLPAMGYGDKQIKDLEETINSTDCDAVVIATPIDLNRIVNIKKPTTRVMYELDDKAAEQLSRIVRRTFG
jgi:predicted GTPase